MEPEETRLISRLREFIGPGKDGTPDEILIKRFTDYRDSEAFELLMWRHFGMVLRICKDVLKDHHLAEDAAQTVFLVFARKMRSLRQPEYVAVWLHRCAYRASLRFARTRKFANGPTELDLVPDRSSPTAKESTPYGDVLHGAIETLPERYRRVILMAYFQGMSHREIAEKMNLPMGTIAAWMARAKTMLHGRLVKRGVVPTALTLGALGTDRLTFAAIIRSTVHAAISFAEGKMVGGMSPIVLQAARELSTESRGTAILLVIASVLIGATAFSSISGIEGRSQSALAPLPKRELIDDPLVEEWRKVGAVPGTFRSTTIPELLESDRKPKIQITRPIFFLRFSREAGEKGLPGFFFGPEKTVEWEKLPKIDVPFGLDLTSSVVDDACLQSLPRLGRLSHLSLNGPTFTSKGVRELARCGDLKSLEIFNQELGDEELKEIAEISGLEKLAIHGLRITDKGVKHLARLVHLKELSVSAPKVTDEGDTELEHLENLRILRLDVLRLSPNSIKRLAGCPRLEMVTLCVREVDSLESLRSLRHCSTLELIFPTAAPGNLTGLKSLTNLRTLKIIAPVGTEHFSSDVSDLRDLERLDIACPQFEDKAIRELASLSNLKHLRLASYKMTTKSLTDISSIKSLERLSLLYTGCGMAGQSDSFAALSQMRDLKALELYCLEWDDDLLKQLTKLDQLSELSLDSTHPPKNTKSIAQLEKIPNLRKLQIGNLQSVRDQKAFEELSAKLKQRLPTSSK